jgi:hypothetical protein
MASNQFFFVLGAPDPEMAEIERVAGEAGHLVAYALNALGERVRPHEAYQPGLTVSQAPPDGASAVWVECSIEGLCPAVIVDHHRPGDPGYGLPAQDYLRGSSLGQVLALLELGASAEQRLIAAADHCLAAAYQGLCPGVAVEDLAAWRARSRAAFQKVSAEDLAAKVAAARAYLARAERRSIAGETVALVPDKVLELPEAALQARTAFLYRDVQEGKPAKVGLMGAATETLRAWMAQCGLDRVYGDPARGFAGGYAPDGWVFPGPGLD